MVLGKTKDVASITANAVAESNSESTCVIDLDAERRLTRKLDFQLLPICYLVLLAVFLDKVNIGNARIQGLEKELHMDPKSNQFNVALSLFWVTYILIEIPSNIILKNVSPPIYLGGTTVLYGVIALCQGLVHNFSGLIACRLFLGLLGGVSSPGITYLLSMYYPRWELQRRYAIIFTNGFMAGAFGGLLAFALAKMDGLCGLSGWRWIFIMEGILTVLVGLLAIVLMFDWPSSTKRLTEAERALLGSRMKTDGETTRMDRLDGKAIKRVAFDWKIYVGALLFFSISISSASVSIFMPTILREFGYSSSEAQIHTIPVWVVSTAVTLGVGWLSDYWKRRAVFVFAGCAVATVGYIMLLCQGPLHQGFPIGVKYLAVFVASAGIFTVQPIIIIWLVTNIAGSYKRAIGVSFVLGWGNLGSIVASNIYLTTEAPEFPTGYGVAFGFIGVEAVLAALFMMGLKRENRKRDRGERDWRFSLPKEELENLGDDHPDYRFNF